MAAGCKLERIRTLAGQPCPKSFVDLVSLSVHITHEFVFLGCDDGLAVPVRAYSEDAREGDCLVAECPGLSSHLASRLQLCCVLFNKKENRELAK